MSSFPSTSPGDRTVISPSLTSGGPPMPDTDFNHDRISASSRKSKAEQLARTRRNQQRCRERKRTHVTELERQVEALQLKIQQCEPCASPPEHENALDTALRENVARRDLLLALGFDDETQQRFIKSAVKRQTVYAILHGAHDRTSPSPNPGERLVEAPLASRARFDTQSARGCAESVDLVPGSGHAMDSLQTNTALTDVAVDWQTEALDSAVENWFLPSETIDEPSPPLVDPSSDSSWLTGSYNSYADLGQGLVNASEPTDSMLGLGAIPKSSSDSSSDGVHWASMTSTNNHSVANPSIESCFLDTVVQLQPAEPSTVCSIALAQIFQHNRKGLSMAELQKQLKPGVRAPSGNSRECCIENSVLFRVLADISK